MLRDELKRTGAPSTRLFARILGIAGMKPLRTLLFAAAASALAVSGTARAGDRAAGRRTVVVCQACHGMDGLSKNPEAPNLAGQVETYLAKALHDYKSGARKNESMNIVARDLTDADIENVAAYYSAIEVDVLPP